MWSAGRPCPIYFILAMSDPFSSLGLALTLTVTTEITLKENTYPYLSRTWNLLARKAPCELLF